MDILYLRGIDDCLALRRQLAPGRRVLVLGGRKALVLITGAALMTAFAAVIEGFWSANPFPPMLRYAVGVLMWGLTLSYLFLCGRQRRHAA